MYVIYLMVPFLITVVVPVIVHVVGTHPLGGL